MTRTLADAHQEPAIDGAALHPANAFALPLLGQDNPNLDVMRSVAVLFVVTGHLALFFGVTPHYFPASTLGHWGVLMFFVHTSFVLILSLNRQQDRRPEQPLFRSFMLRRIFRIAPLATIVILAIVLLKLPVAHLHNGQFQGISLTPGGVLANLLFIQDLTRTDSPEAPLWSLPYEMQMYLVLPLLYIIVRRFSSAMPMLACWIAISVVCYFGLRVDTREPFDMFAYVPCFLAGVGAYGMLQIPHRRWRLAIWPATLIVCSVCYASRPSVLVSWACCLALAIAISRCAAMGHGFFTRTCHLIARYSYGVYLTHFICIWLAFVAFAALPFPLRVVVFVLLVVALPLALYHLIEAPMIIWGARLTRNATFRADPAFP
jgi:peptidoglycan/LPS O-acetylase OafA/YrhL